MKDLYLITGPQRVFNPDRNQKRKEKEKREELLKLDFLDLTTKMSKDEALHNATPGSSSWRAAFMNSLARSLCLKVENVHIRYEDETSFSPNMLAFGLTIESISLRPSRNENLFTHELYSFDKDAILEYINKKFVIKNFSIYCHPVDEVISKKSKDEILRTMSDMIPRTNETMSVDIRHILKPVFVDLSLSIKINSEKGNEPSNIFDANVSAIEVHIDQEQLQLLSSFNKKMEELKLTREFKELKPRVRPRDNPRAWWSFLRHLILSGTKKKDLSSYLDKRRKNRLLYIELRKKKFTEIITPAEAYQLDTLEMELPISDIRYFRALADVEMYISGINTSYTQNSSWKWLKSLWKGPRTKSTNIEAVDTYVLTPELRNHLVESLGETVREKKEVPSQTTFGKVFITGLSLKIKDSRSSPLLVAYTNSISASVVLGFDEEDIEGGFSKKKIDKIQIDVSKVGIRLPHKQGIETQSIDLNTSVLVTIFSENQVNRIDVQLKDFCIQKVLSNKAEVCIYITMFSMVEYLCF